MYCHLNCYLLRLQPTGCWRLWVVWDIFLPKYTMYDVVQYSTACTRYGTVFIQVRALTALIFCDTSYSTVSPHRLGAIDFLSTPTPRAIIFCMSCKSMTPDLREKISHGGNWPSFSLFFGMNLTR